ncbi:MAG: putative transport system ATP-binding protein [Thermoanaerobaculia bacterium]|nr:putative transport system ATP-binding protein [Thermoanaerobaculia bacterium]
MIELEGIEKVYTSPPRTVLKGIDVRIESGEHVAIIGGSGAGKSTLMNILGCLDTPTAGRYRLDGEELTGRSDAERSTVRNRRIGFVFQLFHLLPRLTVMENVLLPVMYSDSSLEEAEARAMELLGKVSMADRASDRPNVLSGGQQQRVAIVRALINEPALVLADEPTGNLDGAAAAGVLDLFDTLVSGGQTLALVTHDPSVAARAARVLEIADGQIVSDRRRTS